MAKSEELQYTVTEAIEMLASIADFAVETGSDTHLSHQECVLIGKQLLEENISWINDQDVNGAVEKIRSLFNTVYDYVSKRYHDGSSAVDQETIEGIKKIMVLVGDAAAKLDRYTDIFERTKISSAMYLPEYRKLQDFYRQKIDQQIDEHILSRWIEGISRSSWHTTEPRGDLEQSKHVFIDLDTVISDSEYELLLLRKGDGSRFYNTRLLRNIKLVCDFGRSVGHEEGRDTFERISLWRDRLFHTAAKNILSVVRYQMEMYYKEAYKYKHRELSFELNKVFMALMLASNPNHLKENLSLKSCGQYFYDFQYFLRHALHTREYQKMLVYSPGKKNFVGRLLLETVQAICCAVYNSLLGMQAVFLPLEEALAEARGKNPEAGETTFLYQRIIRDYRALQKSLKRDASAPLITLVNWIETAGVVDFDPLLQDNLPNHWFDLSLGKKKVSCKRISSPTHQQLINKAEIEDEYKSFLYASAAADKSHLHFNLQDRTSWREYARSVAIEQLDKNRVFGEALHVVTLAVDTNFYHQRKEYADDNDAQGFLQQFKEHLHSDYSGFYFPEIHKDKIYDFCDQIIPKIHKIFFDERPSLFKAERQAFISLAYLFLQLKCIDLYYPDTYSLSCKDGVDLSSVYTGLLFVFFKILSSKRLSEADEEYLNLILLAPSLLVRERVILIDYLDRFLEALGTIETVRAKNGDRFYEDEVKALLGPLYNHPIFSAEVLTPTTFYHF